SPIGHPSQPSSSRTPPERWWPPASCVPTRCRPKTRCVTCWRRAVPGAELHLPAGTASANGDPVVVTPESAGWELCGLRVVELVAGESRVLDTGPDEIALLPLSGGGVVVEVDGRRFELEGRRSVFARVSDWAYVPMDAEVRL